MRKRIAAGNWKMHTDLDGAVSLARDVAKGVAGKLPIGVEVALFPPFPFLWPVAEAVRGTEVDVGAQNCHPAESGAYTGEVSCGMLRSVGASRVLVGHSERRHVFGETDAGVAARTEAVLAAGLWPVVCVGETLEEREAGDTGRVVSRQVERALSGLRSDQLDKVVVAYEPVWAIGTGRTATPGQAAEVHALIRDVLAGLFDRPTAERMPLLYGGSVKAANAGQLMAEPEIDGVLVGGASLQAGEFVEIVKAVAG